MVAETQFLQEFNSASAYLRGFAMKLTCNKSQADDLFQDTALNAFKHQQKFQANSNMKAWLSTIMKNIFINNYRKRKRRGEIQDRTKEGYILNAGHSTIRNDGEMKIRFDDVMEVVDELDEGFRKPFLMAYEGYKYQEIQEEIGNIRLGTVKSRIHQARRFLKKKLANMNFDQAILN